jgi:hypothetical protein
MESQTQTPLMDETNNEAPAPEKTRFCRDCSHLLGNRNYLDNDKIWKCGAEENKKEQKINQVNGLKYYVYHLPFCEDQRKEDYNDKPRCGPSGKWFKLYIKPDFYADLMERNKATVDEAINKPKRVNIKNVTADDL